MKNQFFLDDPDIQGISLVILYNMSIDHAMRPKFIPTNIIPSVRLENVI